MNLTLAIDTSSHNSSVSVLEGETVLTEYNFTSTKDLSATLIPIIDFTLANLNIKLSEIDIFGIASGPGFFTGLRVGIATLKGLLFGKNIPIVPVASLEALADKIDIGPSTIVPLIDARRNEIYASVYCRDKEKMSEKHPPSLIQPEDLKNILKGERNHIFTGNGSEVFEEYLRKNFADCRIIKRSPFLSSEIGKIALKKFGEGEFLTNTGELSPFYIRRPDAEKNLPSG